MNEFVVFDLETTAMKPENGYIVDIAALRVRDGQVVDRFESLVNPGRAIVGHQVHGISTDDVANAPTAAEVLTNFTQWVGDAPVVAHNVSFDLPFVLRHLPPEARWEPTAVFDTLELGYQLYPDAGAWKLADLVRFVFGRDHAAAHRAMPDAEATAELFIHFTSGLAERLEALRNDIADEVRRARDSYNRSEQGEQLEDIRRRHGIGSALMDVLTKATVRELVLSENIRIDGRDTKTIRPISVEVGVLPRTHGSAPLPARPDPGALDRDARARRATCSAWTRSRRRPRSATCTTTTCRRTRSARRSSCAVRAAARSATERSPSGRCCRSCRAPPSSRT